MYPLGPASWPVWLRKLLPYSRRFANAASAHDWLYEIGGKPYLRKWADLDFFELMIDECEDPIQKSCAYAYYILVRTFGWMFFRYR